MPLQRPACGGQARHQRLYPRERTETARQVRRRNLKFARSCFSYINRRPPEESGLIGINGEGPMETNETPKAGMIRGESLVRDAGRSRTSHWEFPQYERSLFELLERETGDALLTRCHQMR